MPFVIVDVKVSVISTATVVFCGFCLVIKIITENALCGGGNH